MYAKHPRIDGSLIVADVSGGAANARLIAAAPEMAELLASAVEQAEEAGEVTPWVATARALLARIEGEGGA